MRRASVVLETTLNFFMLALIMGALIPLWRDVSGSPVDPYKGDSLTRGLLLTGYILVLLLLMRMHRRFLKVFLQSPALVLLLLWAGISLVWSTTPEITLRREAAVSLTSLYGIYLALRFTTRGLLHFLAYTFLALLVVSILLVFFFPEWGLMMGYPYEGAWRGIFVHKNVLGRIAAFGILVFLILVTDGNEKMRNRLFWFGGLLLSLWALIGTRSATSWILAGTTFLSVIGLKITSPYRKLWPLLTLVFLFAAGGVAMALVGYSEILFPRLGRDPTLTGRIPLWLTLLPFIRKRPWTGYGLGGFWLGWRGPSAEVWSQVGWPTPHGHNGYLDLWLELGIVGLLLGLWLLLSLLLQGIRQYLQEGSSGSALFLVGVGIFIALYNLAESDLLRPNNFFWLFLSWGYVSPQVMRLQMVKEALRARRVYPPLSRKNNVSLMR